MLLFQWTENKIGKQIFQKNGRRKETKGRPMLVCGRKKAPLNRQFHSGMAGLGFGVFIHAGFPLEL